MNTWPTVTLKDLVDDRGITYGVVQPGQPTPEGVPILRVNNFTGAGLQFDDVLRIDPNIASRHERSRLRGGEVLITLVGSTGLVAIAPPDVADWNVARAVGVVPLRAEISVRWVAWCLQSATARRFFEAHLNTTVQKTLNLRDLGAVPVPMPSCQEIDAITNVLGPLGDKIDSNRRLAAGLEETAATMFRARFVDFVGLEAFHDGPGGQIPRDWLTTSIYDLAVVTYGRPFKSALFGAEGVPVIRIRDLETGDPSVLTTEERTDARMVKRGDIVVGMDGEFRAHLWAGPEAWLNQRVCVFDPVKGVPRAFVLEAIKRPLAFFEATKGGTTVIHLGKRDIDTFTVVAPPRDVLQEYGEAADPMIELSAELRWEARTLSAVRDALLPKLILGEIRVPDTKDSAEVIEPFAEEAAAS